MPKSTVPVHYTVQSVSDMKSASALAKKCEIDIGCLPDILGTLRLYRQRYSEDFLSQKCLPNPYGSPEHDYPMIAHLMLQIGMLWGESTGYMPLDEFGSTTEGSVPEPKTCSALVVECFEVTGWVCSNAELATNYREMLQILDDVLQRHGDEMARTRSGAGS